VPCTWGETQATALTAAVEKQPQSMPESPEQHLTLIYNYSVAVRTTIMIWDFLTDSSSRCAVAISEDSQFFCDSGDTRRNMLPTGVYTSPPQTSKGRHSMNCLVPKPPEREPQQYRTSESPNLNLQHAMLSR